MMRWLPFLLGAVLFAALYLGLKKPEGHVIASQMVGQPLPQFRASPINGAELGLASSDFHGGKPRLLNVFASWCEPCKAEAPALLQLQAAGAELDGLAVHDTSADLASFLGSYGNPYTRLGIDQDGRGQMALGSSGVPETFVVDSHGMILYQHIGAVTEEDVPKLLTMLRQAK